MENVNTLGLKMQANEVNSALDERYDKLSMEMHERVYLNFHYESIENDNLWRTGLNNDFTRLVNLSAN